MSSRDDMNQPSVYEFRVQGAFTEWWRDWRERFTFVSQANGETLLVGPVADQADLHGLLDTLQGLALPLISVRRVRGINLLTEPSVG